MSRSIKKNWVIGKNKASAYYRRRANKLVRKTEDISNGCEYKKYGNPYDICDYRWYQKGYTNK